MASRKAELFPQSHLICHILSPKGPFVRVMYRGAKHVAQASFRKRALGMKRISKRAGTEICDLCARAHGGLTRYMYIQTRDAVPST